MTIRLQRLQVSDNQRFVIHEDGSPFFWLGDTAWELIHKLDREDADVYLRNRAELKFNVIQAVALAEMDGVRSGNAYGRLPLKQNSAGKYDPSMPDLESDYSYWDHVDYIIDRAGHYGLYIAFLPTWGDKYSMTWGKGPEIFDHDLAYAYGKWLGDRYKDRPNLIWVLGGDRHLQVMEHFSVNRALAAGLREGDEGGHLITFHPPGDLSSSHYMHDEDWLDFNMIQSGHHEQIRTNYTKVEQDYRKIPVKPTLDGEPCYEDHPVNFKAVNGYFDQADVRQAAYYAVFTGAFGHTYGHHSIWSMTSEPGEYYVMSWKSAIHRPGAAQMRHLRSLIESRSFFDRVPDQSLLAQPYSGANYMAATRGDRYAMLYSPNGIPFTAVMGKVQGSHIQASWYDPRTGRCMDAGHFANVGEIEFQPPSSGRGEDWVLVLDGKEESK